MLDIAGNCRLLRGKDEYHLERDVSMDRQAPLGGPYDRQSPLGKVSVTDRLQWER